MKRIVAVVVLFSMIGVSMGAQLVWDIMPLDPTIFGGDFNESNAWSINNSKQIVGEVWKQVDNTHLQPAPAVWDFSDPEGWGKSHTMVTEDESMYLTWPSFGEINDAGQVSGNYLYVYPGMYDNHGTRPMVYNIHNRTIRDLGCLGDDKDDHPFLDDYLECYGGSPDAINNNGTIIGHTGSWQINMWGRREVTFKTLPTAWYGPGKPESLSGLEADDSISDMNNKGLIVGMTLGYPDRAFQVHGGAISYLPVPSDHAGWNSRPSCVNDNGLIVGYLGTSETNDGVLWHPEAGCVLLPSYPGYNGSYPRAINIHGTIVGSSNGAVIWVGSGTNYAIISLDMFAAQTGWTLDIAHDINDDGWIVGQGRYLGRDMGFLARPRLDENPPIANLDPEKVTNKKGKVTIVVVYSDDNGMNESSLDNKDIQAVYPDKTIVAAKFELVKEVEPDPASGKRKYEAQYSFSTPPMNPMNAEGAIIRIVAAESEISDLSGRYVTKGSIGDLNLTFPAATATILKGLSFDSSTSTRTWKFESRLYTGPVDSEMPILDVKFQPPGSSSWYMMTSGDGEVWEYVQSASDAAALSAFGNGDYVFRITVDMGGPMDVDKTFRYGMSPEGVVIPTPTSHPTITSPQQAGKISHKNIPLTWVEPNDPSITSMICSIIDVATDDEVFYKIISGGIAATAGEPTLLPDRNYILTVYYCGGFQNNSESGGWKSYKLIYTAARLAFSTQQYAGDINDDGVVNMSDLSLLSAYWTKSSSQAGWNVQYDLQPSGVIDLGDLLIVAQYWLQ
jgi:hypothetical protein